jgi:hypothetical protein
MNYLEPLHPELKLRLDDVMLNHKSGEIKVIVTADKAMLKVEETLADSLRGFQIKPLGSNQFELAVQMIRLNHESSVPDDQHMNEMASQMVGLVSSAAKLDLGMEVVAQYSKSEDDEYFPMVKIVKSGGKEPSPDFQYALASVVMDRMDNSKTITDMNLDNPLGGIETDADRPGGGKDYVTCDLVSHEPETNSAAASRRAIELAEKIAHALGINDATRSQSRA